MENKRTRGFEVVSEFKDKGINLPIRKTKFSGGYDIEVAEDVIIMPVRNTVDMPVAVHSLNGAKEFYKDLENRAKEIINKMDKSEDKKELKTGNLYKPTLVKTGLKAYMQEDEYLALHIRSSVPLNYMLVMANDEGIIDSDYYNNEDNEGHFQFQILNIGTVPIHLKKGDIIGQAIFKKFLIADNDCADGERTGGFGSTTK